MSPEVHFEVGCISGNQEVKFSFQSGDGQNAQHGSDAMDGINGTNAPNQPVRGSCKPGCHSCGHGNCPGYNPQAPFHCGENEKGSKGSDGGRGGNGGDGGNSGGFGSFKTWFIITGMF